MPCTRCNAIDRLAKRNAASAFASEKMILMPLRGRRSISLHLAITALPGSSKLAMSDHCANSSTSCAAREMYSGRGQTANRQAQGYGKSGGRSRQKHHETGRVVATMQTDDVRGSPRNPRAATGAECLETRCRSEWPLSAARGLCPQPVPHCGHLWRVADLSRGDDVEIGACPQIQIETGN